VADELTRDEVKERLEAIFTSSLEGNELDKALASIEKRLDKFEGKWEGLIKWAETKHGKPSEPEEAPEADQAEPEEATEAEQAEPEEKTSKKRGFFAGLRGKKNDPEPEEESSPDAEQTEETAAEQPPTDEMSREDATGRLTAIFESNLEGAELEKMLESIPQRLDKFEGKWPKLILWAEGKFGAADPGRESGHSEEVETKVDIESTLELIISGDADSALSNLKKMISEDSTNPDLWRGMASLFSSLGMPGRSSACEEKAESL